jgi:hypothetical protein
MKDLEEKINDVILEHLGRDMDEFAYCNAALDALTAVECGLGMRRQELIDEACALAAVECGLEMRLQELIVEACAPDLY